MGLSLFMTLGIITHLELLYQTEKEQEDKHFYKMVQSNTNVLRSQFWLSLQSGHFGSIAYIFVVKLFPLNTIYFLQLTFYI